MQGTRTHAEQQVTYDQGRTLPGKIVTNAEPGDSYHQYGLAIDVVPRAYKAMPDWNPSGPLWIKIGQLAEAAGLEWGGRWSKPDRPHVQIPEAAAPLDELKAYWEKFKGIMPVSITPTTGGLAAIAIIGVVFYFFVLPRLRQSGMI